MSCNDLLSDMIARIRNGQRAKKSTITSPSSKVLKGVLEVLQAEGYIRGYSEKEVSKGKKELEIELKYFEGQPVIKEIKRLSTSGKRVYSAVDKLPKFFNGLGIVVLTTPKGIMSDYGARKANVGGELLCSVF